MSRLSVTSVFALWVAASISVAPALAQHGDPEAVEIRLRHMIAAHGTIVVEALDALPETKELARAALSEEGWDYFASPTLYGGMVTKEQEDQALVAVSKHIASLPQPQEHEFWSRFQRWLVLRNHIEAIGSLIGAEDGLGAAYALPVTGTCFDDVLQSRSLDPGETHWMQVAASMSSAEHYSALICVVTIASSLEDYEVIRFMRDLHNELLND